MLHIMQPGDELHAIVIRDADIFAHDAAEGVKWLDGDRHLLQEFDALNKHSIPLMRPSATFNAASASRLASYNTPLVAPQVYRLEGFFVSRSTAPLDTPAHTHCGMHASSRLGVAGELVRR